MHLCTYLSYKLLVLSWYIIAIVYHNSLSAVDVVVSRHIFDRWRNLRSSLLAVSIWSMLSRCIRGYVEWTVCDTGHSSAAVCPAVWHYPCTEGGKLICLDFWVGLFMWVVLYTQGKQFLYGDTSVLLIVTKLTSWNWWKGARSCMSSMVLLERTCLIVDDNELAGLQFRGMCWP